MYNRTVELFQYSIGKAYFFLPRLPSLPPPLESIVLLPSFCSGSVVSSMDDGISFPAEPVNIFFGVYKTDNPPIRLSYHSGIHYNSVVDPNKATIGVGLGLAGHKPGVSPNTENT